MTTKTWTITIISFLVLVFASLFFVLDKKDTNPSPSAMENTALLESPSVDPNTPNPESITTGEAISVDTSKIAATPSAARPKATVSSSAEEPKTQTSTKEPAATTPQPTAPVASPSPTGSSQVPIPSVTVAPPATPPATPPAIIPEKPTPVASSTLYGVTIDDVDNINPIIEALTALPKKMTARIVFDEVVQPSYYASAISKIHDVSYIMAEPVDSEAMDHYNLATYSKRFSDSISAYNDKVDIWEVGNEINGEWLGPEADVAAKIEAGYDLVKAANGKTAITLFYNEGLYCAPAANSMYTWSQKNLSAKIKNGVDYVLVSYYPESCPDAASPDWSGEFNKIGSMFPNAKIGFGETGYMDATDAKKALLVQEFYGMNIGHPRYIKGVFWWMFRQEMVPKTKALWQILYDAIK